MDADAAREFIAANHRAVMATYRSDGRLQMSPVGVGVDDGGRVVVSSRETAVKVANLRRDPRTSICVVSDEWYGRWIRVDGRAELVSLPEAMELLVDYYRGIRGEHPDWDEYRQAMLDERRVLVRIAIEGVGPTRSG